VTRSRTLRGLVLAATSAAALSGCGAHPGAAAVVGDERITEARVDDVAAALCSAQGGAQQTTSPQELASRAARQGALDILVSGALSHQFGASQGVEPDEEQVAAAISSNQATIDALPAKSRATFTSTLQEYAEGQLMLIDIGREQLRKSGTANAPQEQAIAAGTKLRDQWAEKHADVTVDPRYGTYANGALQGGSGSLSVPASSRAVDGAKPNPSPSWVSALPASQKCS
jgi:hypothetical protein